MDMRHNPNPETQPSKLGGGQVKTTVRIDTRNLPDQVTSIRRDRCTLTVLSGHDAGAVHAASGSLTLVGRDRSCAVCVEDAGVSAVHASITHRKGKFLLEDRQSTNGTFLNGVRISSEQPLSDGDRLQLGVNTLLKISLQDAVEQEVSRRMYDSAVRDPLTGLHNRRFLIERLGAEYAFAARHETSLSVIFGDVDFFKKVNDQHGHAAGDEVLRAVGECLADSVRREDIVSRFGGEEFVIVARGISHENALIFAERVRSSVERLRIAVPGKSPNEPQKALTVTISLGVATMHIDSAANSAEALLALADERLYRAKKNGRNQVCDR